MIFPLNALGLEQHSRFTKIFESRREPVEKQGETRFKTMNLVNTGESQMAENRCPSGIQFADSEAGAWRKFSENDILSKTRGCGGMADTGDLKSPALTGVRVRAPPSAQALKHKRFRAFLMFAIWRNNQAFFGKNGESLEHRNHQINVIGRP